MLKWFVSVVAKVKLRQFSCDSFTICHLTVLVFCLLLSTSVCAMTEKVTAMQRHLRTHLTDRNCKRDLEKLIADRRKYMRYFRRKDFELYREVVNYLGIRDIGFPDVGQYRTISYRPKFRKYDPLKNKVSQSVSLALCRRRSRLYHGCMLCHDQRLRHDYLDYVLLIIFCVCRVMMLIGFVPK